MCVFKTVAEQDKNQVFYQKYMFEVVWEIKTTLIRAFIKIISKDNDQAG